jgi:hypothetical protein
MSSVLRLSATDCIWRWQLKISTVRLVPHFDRGTLKLSWEPRMFFCVITRPWRGPSARALTTTVLVIIIIVITLKQGNLPGALTVMSGTGLTALFAVRGRFLDITIGTRAPGEGSAAGAAQ